MAFNPALPTAVDRIRLDLGDFNDAAPILSEAIYTALYARYDSDEDRAKVAAAEALIAKVAQDPDKVEVTGAVKVEWQSRLASWRAIANGLRAQLGLPILGATDNTLHVGQLVRTASSGSEFGG